MERSSSVEGGTRSWSSKLGRGGVGRNLGYGGGGGGGGVSADGLRLEMGREREVSC